MNQCPVCRSDAFIHFGHCTKCGWRPVRVSPLASEPAERETAFAYLDRTLKESDMRIAPPDERNPSFSTSVFEVKKEPSR